MDIIQLSTGAKDIHLYMHAYTHTHARAYPHINTNIQTNKHTFEHITFISSTKSLSQFNNKGQL